MVRTDKTPWGGVGAHGKQTKTAKNSKSSSLVLVQQNLGATSTVGSWGGSVLSPVFQIMVAVTPPPPPPPKKTPGGLLDLDVLAAQSTIYNPHNL